MRLFIAVVAATALAAAGTASAGTRSLSVYMHDPGCHSFKVAGHFSKKASVAGPVRLRNYDEAALKVVSRHGVVGKVAVGKSLLLKHGKYVVTMVHQASDDNFLSLTVK